MFVPPDTNRGPRFEMQFFEDVLHVFLHGSRAAAENLTDFAVAFAGGDPLDDFELAFGEGTRPLEIAGSALVYYRGLAVPGGHGEPAFSGRQGLRPYA